MRKRDYDTISERRGKGEGYIRVVTEKKMLTY